MKRFLRWLVDFLERKFPDKVVVTAASYKDLEKRVADQEKAIAVGIKNLDDRLIAIEMQVANINMAMGMSAPKLGMLQR